MTTAVTARDRSVPDRRPPPAPGHLFLELSRQPKQRGLVAIASGEHHTDRETSFGLPERQRNARLSGEIEWRSEGKYNALAALDLSGFQTDRVDIADFGRCGSQHRAEICIKLLEQH